MWQFIALEIKEKDNMKGVYASIDYSKDEEVFTLTGTVSDVQTRTSIKVGDDKHIEDKFGAFINHSCNPTVKIQDGTVVAIKKISRHEEITFDYQSNEDDLTNPFICICCDKLIQ